MGITTREYGPYAKGSRLTTEEMDENFNFLNSGPKSSDFIPSVDNTWTLGTTGYRWKSIYVGEGLTFGDNSVQTTAYVPTTSGNMDNLGGANMRTIYSRTNVITYNVGTDADLFSGSTNFGSRNFPSSFFTNSVNYSNKIIHFRVTGKWGTIVNPDSDVVITTKFGNDIVATSSITLDFSSNKPSEIFGEIIINNGSAIVCYSVGWCDQTGDFRRSPLSDPSTPLVVSGFDGGDFKLIIGSDTDNIYTSYTGYIQVWN